MATIRDVARESGVSVATVSYVLNNGPRPVSSQARERVIAAMQSLDYHPSAAARSLVRRRTHTLGIVVGHVQPEVVTNGYYAGILSGVFSAAFQRRYNIVLFTEQGSTSQVESRIRTQRPDGVLMISPDRGIELPERLTNAGIPVGIVGSEDEYAATGAIQMDVDNRLGTRLAVEHLLERGHKKILHMTGAPNQPSACVRRMVFEAVMQEHGLTPAPEDTLFCHFTPAHDAAMLAQRLADEPAITAIFAGNDDLGLTALQFLNKSPHPVPEKIAVVGFDDAPLANYITPGLTTIHQPMREIGEAITQKLADQIEGNYNPSGSVQYFPPYLVVRGST